MAEEWKCDDVYKSHYRYINKKYEHIIKLYLDDIQGDRKYRLYFYNVLIDKYHIDDPTEQYSLDHALDVLSDSIKNTIHFVENTEIKPSALDRFRHYLKCKICLDRFSTDKSSIYRCYNHVMGHSNMTKSASKQ